jgi:endo-1,3(4)-beta-glucanase
MGRINKDFIKRFGPHVDTIFHDVAHGSNADSRSATSDGIFFPLARHKSWFDGHSFATGMFRFGTGKSQESSSEAVNGYYGAYLWSLVRHGTIGSDVTDFARLLLAMEIRGARTYWHMLPPKYTSNSSIVSQIYNPNFQGHYMVGNVGMLDVAVNTWFGNDPLYVHMINVIPVTAATGFLFDENYVKHEYPYLMESRSSVEMAWRGYTTSIHAIIDPNAAWKEAQGLVSYQLDSALSKSQVLYWISQRSGFNITAGPGDNTYNHSSPSTDGDSSCASHPECAATGLTGKCCPTFDGTNLGCC